MKKYIVPVVWMMYGEYEVEAESAEEAGRIAKDIPELPVEKQYADGFEVETESIQELKEEKL